MNLVKSLAISLLALFLSGCFESKTEQAEQDPPGVGTPPPSPPANGAPSIGALPAETAVTAGNAFQVAPSASDPDNDPLTFTVENKPDWAAFNASNGRLTGTPTDGDVGSYEGIRISVRDGVHVTWSNAFRVVVNARSASPPPPAPSPRLLFSDGFESGNTSGWNASSTGGVTVLNSGQAYRGSFYGGAALATGDRNDRNLYVNLGTPGNLATQIRDFSAQCAVSFDAFSGDWNSSDPQKMLTFQYYDSTWNGGSYSNSNRKFQVLVQVVDEGPGDPHAGEYFVQIYEFNNETGGSFRDAGNLYQNSTRYGPADSFGRWDVLRLEVQLDTNGSATVGRLGPGNGNGVIRLWRNNEVILEYTNVNIVRGNPNVGMGRAFVTAGPSGTWAGTSTTLYWDAFELANDPSALSAMPSAPVQRVSTGSPTPPPPAPEPPPPSGEHNPDGITETSSILYGRDYESQAANDVEYGSVINMQWGSGFGYAGSGGWRAQPNPISGTGQNEDSKGWSVPADLGFNRYNVISASFTLKITGSLLAAIETAGGFWSHLNKSLDFHYYDSSGGLGGRGGFHFGEMPPRWHIAGGGAGPYFPVGPDWRTLADQWVWLCFVIDMRGATPEQRYLAVYYKTPDMTGVARMGRVYESQGLQSYGGHGIVGFPLTEIFGYWDDMNSRAAVESSLNQMFVYIDRMRIMPGYPNAANGPPF
jgi:hypothetical protein